MKHQRAIVLSGLLAAAVAAAVTGVAAQRDEPGSRRGERLERGDREWSPGVFVGQDGPDRRVLRLDGRGSQIGVMVRDGESSTEGVSIDAVDDGGPAAKAGATAGDVVVEFDGERVRSARQLTRLVQESPPGRAVKMTVARGGSRITLDVTPASNADTFNVEFGPEMRAEIERGMRDLPRLAEPMFNFRFDGMPAVPGRGRLGVEVQTLSGQLGEYFGVKGGVLVSTVRQDSPAEKAGVKAGDVITAVNGTAIRDARELAEEVARASSKADLTLGITRDKKATTLKATIDPPAGRPGRRVRPA